MRSASASLSSFEVAVAGRSTTLTGLQNVRIHSETHRTSRFTPLESGIEKNPIQTFGFRGMFHALRTRHNHRADGFVALVSPDNSRGCAQVFDARVRTRANENPINCNVR